MCLCSVNTVGQVKLLLLGTPFCVRAGEDVQETLIWLDIMWNYTKCTALVSQSWYLGRYVCYMCYTELSEAKPV